MLLALEFAQAGRFPHAIIARSSSFTLSTVLLSEHEVARGVTVHDPSIWFEDENQCNLSVIQEFASSVSWSHSGVVLCIIAEDDIQKLHGEICPLFTSGPYVYKVGCCDIPMVVLPVYIWKALARFAHHVNANNSAVSPTMWP